MLNSGSVELEIVQRQVLFGEVNLRAKPSEFLWAIQVERFCLACKMLFFNHFCVIENDILREMTVGDDDVVIHPLASFINRERTENLRLRKAKAQYDIQKAVADDQEREVYWNQAQHICKFRLSPEFYPFRQQ